jgi:hypothetical protein
MKAFFKQEDSEWDTSAASQTRYAARDIGVSAAVGRGITVNRFLLDVNVLIALIDPAHIQHDRAHGWFAKFGKKPGQPAH